MKEKVEESYHHGNLKEELIEIGIKMITKEGVDKLSIRKAAAACGVSHNAPYSHFKNKEEYLKAIKQYVEQRFAEALLQAAQRAEGLDEEAILIELGRGYITFFCEHPQYRMILATDIDLEINISETAISASNYRPFQIFCEKARDYLVARGIPEEEQSFKIIAQWVMVQGITDLITMASVHYVGDKSLEEYIGRILKELR